MSTDAERSSIRYGTTTLAYVVQRGRRVKTVAIAVDREGVLVRAPAETPLDRLDEIVRGKARWIADRLRRFRELPPAPSAREFVSGETFLYLGRQARLLVEMEGSEKRVRLISGRLVVPVSAVLTGRDRAAAVKKKLISWYRDHAEAPPTREGRALARDLGAGTGRRPHPQPGEALGILRCRTDSAVQLAHHPGARVPHRLRGRSRAGPPPPPPPHPRLLGCAGPRVPRL